MSTFKISNQKFICIVAQIAIIVSQIVAGQILLERKGNIDQFLLIFSWFCFIGFLVQIYLWKKISTELLCPYMVFFVVLFVFSCGQTIGWTLGIDLGGQDLWNRHDYGMNHKTILTSLYYSAVGISLFNLGALVNYRKVRIEDTKWNADDVYLAYKNLSKLLLVICIPSFLASTVRTVVAVALGGYSAYYTVMENRSALFTILERISDYYQPCLVLLFIAHRNNRTIRNICIGMMLIETVSQLFIGGRSGAVMTVLGIILIIHYFVKPFDKRKIIKLGVCGYFGLALLNAILETRNIVGRNLGDVIVVIGASFSDTIGHFIGELGWTLSSTIWTMMLVPDSYPYRYGMTYIVSFLAPIPNLGFWKIHPAQQYANLGDWLQEKLNYGHGIGYSMVAESYINFGWYGWSAMFIIGMILVCFLARVKREDIDKDLVGATFQILIIMTIMKSLVRSSFSVAIRQIVYVLLPLYFIIIISLRRIENR